MEILEQAKKLAEAINTSEEYIKLTNVVEKIKKEKEAYEMLTNLKERQNQVQKIIMVGEKPNEEEIEKIKELYHICILNPLLAMYFQAEYEFTKMATEVQKIIAKELNVNVNVK